MVKLTARARAQARRPMFPTVNSQLLRTLTSMKVGIVGFPGAGKTTVFNALTGLHAAVGGYGDPGKANLGSIKVPDARIDRLSEIFQPRKTTYAETVFVDVPGASAGASALDQATLNQMRDADALALVVRGFPDPLERDARGSAARLRELSRRADSGRSGRHREAPGACAQGAEGYRDRSARTLSGALEAETPLRRVELSAAEERALAGFALLSRLPLLVALNCAESDAGRRCPRRSRRVSMPTGWVGSPCARRSKWRSRRLPADERGAFLADLGLKESARDRFIQAAYGLLDLISFLTSGEDEVRAWPIRRGTTARESGRQDP